MDTRLESADLPGGELKATLVTKRHHGNINSDSRDVLQHWCADIEIQLIPKWENTVLYMV